MKELPLKAKLYIVPVILMGLALLAWQLLRINEQSFGMFVLAGIASITQVFKVEGRTRKSSYNISWLVVGFTLVSLGTPAAMFVILASHLVEWLWHKYPWYIQSFNIASYALAISAAGTLYEWINPNPTTVTFISTLGLITSLAAFTLLNHLLVGTVIWLARGQNFSQSGVFSFFTLMMDLTLIGLGVATAFLWSISPSAAVFTLIPLYLLYGALKLPALQRQTESDPKTGLYNARHFAGVLRKEIDRANRFDRPLTVVLGDLDLLRNINNTYGHLAGDVVLKGIADILSNSFRGYDLVARFGGEEFAVLMPETTPEQAYPRVEAIREAIESTGFNVSTNPYPIRATMSFGVAGRDGFRQTAEDIVHNADVVLYEAKLNGRNRTFIHNDPDIERLFGIKTRAPHYQLESNQQPERSRRRFEFVEYSYQPNPIREKSAAHQFGQNQQTPTAPIPGKTPRPKWHLDAFIAAAAFTVLGLGKLVLHVDPTMDWFGLSVFALLVLLAEGLSIDIYTKDNSVSTSAAPLIAGVLLFGSMGALVLGIILAGTAMLKHRSPIKRFIFNTSNHLISGFLVAGLVARFSGSITDQPLILQFGIAIASGGIVFLGTTLLLAHVISIDKNQTFRQVWNTNYRWLAVYYLAFGGVAFVMVISYQFAGIIGLLALLFPLWALRYSQIQYLVHTKDMVQKLRVTNQRLEKKSAEISTLNDELLVALANTIDLRTSYTMEHSKYVAKYAVMIAEELELPSVRVEIIRKAALLHDIGKIGIPDKILLKPGSLTDQEYDQIKRHPVLGAEFIQTNHSLQNIVPIIRHHHERWDGKGYPDGLGDKEIPLEARIIGLADAFESMASDRPHRKGLDLEHIKREVSDNSGTQFDPEIVKAFLTVVEKEGEKLIKNANCDGQEESGDPISSLQITLE